MVAFCICAISVDAEAQSAKRTLVPLRAYMSDKDLTNDRGGFKDVLVRCTGLYDALRLGMNGETAPNKVRMREFYSASDGNFIDAWITLDMTGATRSLEQAGERIRGRTLDAGEVYRSLIEEARTHYGDFTKDPILAGDLEVCATLSRPLVK